jgi:carbon-monoxide dehydrogenase large subunit
MSILGTRVLRIEDPRFLTTGGVYTEDVVDDRLANACHVFFVRSPVAHGRILSIDATAAKTAPGVVAVFTAADLAELPVIPPFVPAMMNKLMTQTLLASDTVRYVGEPVAAVITEQHYQGEDATELVEVDYDVSPAVVSMDDALADEVLLFPEAGTNVVARFGDAAAGNPDLFADCEVVVRREIVNQRVAPAPMESRSAAAAWGQDGRLTAWVPNQGAQGTKEVLVTELALEAGQVRVITPDVGGAFGAKFGADPEVIVVAWAPTQRSGRCCPS